MENQNVLSHEMDWLHPLLSGAETERDPAGALALIRQHLGSLSLPLPRLDLCGDLSTQADSLLNRQLRLLNENLKLDTPVNWHRLAETDGQRNWHLGYMYWINPLAKAYAETGDECYARQWRSYVEEFIDGCPYAADARGYWPTRDMVLNDKKTCNLGENGGPRHKEAPPEQRHQWMSLSCHFRIDTWLAGLSRLATSPELDDNFLAKCLLSLTRDHAFVCVMNPRENTPNQFTAVTLSLLRLSLALPMFRSHAAHFLVAWERLQRVFTNTMYPDGSDAEQSPNYNLFLLDLCVELLDLLEEAPDSRKTVIREAAAKRLVFLEAIQTPDGQLPPIAKGHLEPLRDRLTHARQELNLPPAVPPSAVSHFPYGGYHVLRQPDSWLQFKSSPAGNGHMHEDCLSFQLWIDGQEVLSDPSHYTYEMKDPEERELNEWAMSTAAHNAVLVNGSGQRRQWLRHHGDWKDDEVPTRRAAEAEPLPFRCVGNERIRFLEGVYSEGFETAKQAEHRRQILEIAGEGWLILDWIHSAETATRCWQIAPKLKESLQSDEQGFQVPGLRGWPLEGPVQSITHSRFHFPDYAVKVPAAEVQWTSKLSPGSPLVSWLTRDPEPLLIERTENSIRWSSETKPPLCLTWTSTGDVQLELVEGQVQWNETEGDILYRTSRHEHILPPLSTGSHI